MSLSLNGRTRLAGIIGWPVDHSRSPAIHNYWAAQHEVDFAYVPLPVRPDGLASAVRGLAALGFYGANVTIPHKEAVIPLLDRLDAAARAIGAVNTLVVDAAGAIEGRNTDAGGFLQSLWAGAPDWQPKAGPAVVVGAGGAARAVVWALQQAGVPDIRVINRTVGRAQALAAEFGPPVRAVAWNDEAFVSGQLLVNTTSCGMKGENDLEVPLARLAPAAAVVDIVYTPLETGLLRAARAQGLIAVDGLGMLLYQAQAAFAAWTGVTPVVDSTLRDYVLGGGK